MTSELFLLQMQRTASAPIGLSHRPANAAKAPSYRAMALAAALCMAGASQAAPSAVTPGQLGIVSVSNVNAKPVSFVLMCNAKAGTTLEFTDNGWLDGNVAVNPNSFRPNEGVVTWIAARDVSAGEVITFSELVNPRVVVPAGVGSANSAPSAGAFNIAAGGDSVIVFQGTLAQPKMIFGLNYVASGAWNVGENSANTSALPPGLINGQTAVAVTNQQVQDYTGVRAGTAAQLMTAISTQSNWTGRTAIAQSAAPTALTVTDAVDCADLDEVAPPPPPPADTITRISAIRTATGATNPQLLGRTVNVSAVVTAYLPGMRGFALQEADADRDNTSGTSPGIFVFYSNTPPTGVGESLVGRRVNLTAQVSEFNGQTQLSNISNFAIGAAEALPTPGAIQLPVAQEIVWKQHEGMVVEVCGANDQPLVVTDTFQQGRFGNVVLSGGVRQIQFTENNLPGVAANRAFVQQTRLNRIILDDGISAQNPPEHLGRGGQLLSAANTLRGGDQTDCVTGVVDQFIDTTKQEHEIDFRIQPTKIPMFSGPARPTAADLQQSMQGSNLKVASVNVLNFFVTPNNVSFTVPGTSITQTGRGADARVTIEGQALTGEFQRQLDKLVAKLIALDADVYGLNEIQNDGYGPNSSLAALVNALNAQAGQDVYAYVGADGLSNGARDLPALGTDAIAVAIVYNKQRVQALGQGVAPDVSNSAYNAFTAAYGNRVPVAQTFRVLALAEDDPDALVTVAVNHFKSKGSIVNNEVDQGDGQGNNNPARVRAAQQLQAWLATNPTGYPQAHTVLTGDFNSYSREDPIRVLEAAGYQQQNQQGDYYSYSFAGLWGSLDHILTSSSMQGKIAAVVNWAVNADEPPLIDYNYNFKTLAQTSNYYRSDYYRASDHNPILVGFNLGRDGTGPGPEPQPEPQPIANFEFGVPGSSSDAVLTGSLTGGGGTCTPTASGAPAQVAPATVPENVRFPYQLLQFELEGCAPQSTVTVTLNLPAPAPANAQYWKWGPTADNATPHWYTIPFTRTGAQQIQFQIQDGGLGDSNLQADGHIIDPGGLGVPADVVPPVTGAVTPVPVDNPWMLSLLAAVMAGLGLAAGRRSNRKA